MTAASSLPTLSILALLLLGCAGGSTRPGGDEEDPLLHRDPPIRTDQPVYIAEQGTTRLGDGTPYGSYVRLTIGLRYTNATASSISLPTCLGVNPPVLEKKQGSGWVLAFAPVVPACLGPPEIIEPGKTFEYTYRIEGYLPGSRVWPQFETAVPGTYRLVWTAYATWTPDGTEPGLGQELPLADRVSNEFEIRE